MQVRETKKNPQWNGEYDIKDDTGGAGFGDKMILGVTQDVDK